MKRRDFLAATGLAAVGMSTFPLDWVSASQGERRKMLYFTRSAGFVHGPVKRVDGELAFSENVMIELGKRAGFEVECTQDGRVFDGDLAQYDVIAFYTSGDLTKPNPKLGDRDTPPMTARGKQRFFDTIAGGKGFVGIHAATDTFRGKGAEGAVDPFIGFIGGEFSGHGKQQEATVTVTAPAFPGLEGVDGSLRLLEEWYTFRNIATDLHVILRQETEDMEGPLYERPPFPATWARTHGKGRVYYTSFGHREDIWTNPTVQQIMLGGIAWAMGNVDADVTPNIDTIAPGANQLPG